MWIKKITWILFPEKKVLTVVDKLKNSLKLKIYMQPSDIKQLSTAIMDNLSKNDNRTISFEINENLHMLKNNYKWKN